MRAFVESLAVRGLVRSDWVPHWLATLGVPSEGPAPAPPAALVMETPPDASGWPHAHRDRLCDVLIDQEVSGAPNDKPSPLTHTSRRAPCAVQRVAGAAKSASEAARWVAMLEAEWLLDAFWAASRMGSLVQALVTVVMALDAVTDKGAGTWMGTGLVCQSRVSRDWTRAVGVCRLV